MSEDWTRRQMLGRAGAAAAGVAGLGLVGCSTDAASPPPAASPPTSALPANGGGDGDADGVEHFVTRPDLTPPVVTVTRSGLGRDSRYTFMNAPWSGYGHGGSVIRDSGGDLVWMGANTPGHHRMDFNTQTYRGKPVLTWWDGTVVDGYGLGVGMIADSSYRTTHVVHAARGLMADLHEFNLTPQGTALISAYRKSVADLSSVGGPSRGYLVSGVAQEIDIATGKLLFEWDSLDHVPLTESQQAYTPATRNNPYNYFHINSIAVAPDGDLLISGRNTWTVYKVARPSGKIAWRLGGKKSDFTRGPGARFYWQHHVRPHGPAVLTVFDNGAAPAHERHSRALVLDLDTTAMRVSLRKAFIHPHKTLLADAMGSAELMPDGRMYVGWGTQPYYSEFAPDGTLLMDAEITKGHPSYRSFSYDWTGHPTERPAAAARTRHGGATVYASWNGATDVASWAVLAGKTASSLTVVGSARRLGFETAAAVRSAGPYFAVEPRDAAGHVLARSAVVKIRDK